VAKYPKTQFATCAHPWRKSYGRGLCSPCYASWWQSTHEGSNSGPDWIRRHPEAFRRYKRKATLKKHGLTLEDYERMWSEQDGRCANSGCRVFIPLEMPDYRHALQVDHNHKTGQIRGLLCPGCNLGAGCMDDNPERLRGLALYLEERPGQT
jgi:Recombination endonuclease VII